MPLDYLKLKNQISQLGSQAHDRDTVLRSALVKLTTLLNEHASNLIALQKMVEEEAAKTKGLRCAVPVEEPLNTHIPCRLPAPPCTIFAADGSQIIPDPHDTVLYGLINIGGLCMRPGSGNAPAEFTFSSLLYEDSLYTAGGTISEDLVSLQRDVLEREILAGLSADEPPPVVTLTDGPLELYHEPRMAQEFRPWFDKYLVALNNLALQNVITAGYVSRPRADLVVKLLSLVAKGEAAAPIDANPFGLTDTALFSHLLQPGERSAIFKFQSRTSADYPDRKELFFFYLNAGTARQPAFARVEIPKWVLEKKEQVDLLHSVLVEQARQTATAPYPYPLIRAHEIAVVRQDDHQQLTRMIEDELARQGFPPAKPSEKQANKNNLGPRKRKSR